MDQPHLFPLADLKTEGYAEPEARTDTANETTDDETAGEAEAA